MNTKKKLTAVLLTCLMVTSTVFPTFAHDVYSNGPMPRIPLKDLPAGYSWKINIPEAYKTTWYDRTPEREFTTTVTYTVQAKTGISGQYRVSLGNAIAGTMEATLETSAELQVGTQVTSQYLVKVYPIWKTYTRVWQKYQGNRPVRKSLFSSTIGDENLFYQPMEKEICTEINGGHYIVLHP